jgi:hypothetical protein
MLPIRFAFAIGLILLGLCTRPQQLRDLQGRIVLGSKGDAVGMGFLRLRRQNGKKTDQ